MQAVFNRALGDLQDMRQFFNIITSEIVQDDCRAVFFGKPAHCLPQLEIFLVFISGNRINRAVLLLIGRKIGYQLLPSVASQAVTVAINAYCSKPMFKGKCVIVLIPFAIHSQPRFLIEVFGVVLIAAQLDATNITLTPLSKKGKTEKYMKNARSLAVSFTVTKNVTAQNGMRTFYVRVMPPEGEVLDGGGTFAYAGKQLAWSMKKDVEYTGEEISQTLYWTVNEYLGGGQYNVSIFCDGQAIGQRNFTFNK